MALFQKKTEEKTQASAGSAAPQVLASSPVVIKSLVKPRVSEKASRLARSGKYVFEIASGVNKITVKKAVESAYKVKVLFVNIVNVGGKTRNFGRIAGRTSGLRKAIVTLKPGEKIEGVGEVA